MLIDTEYRNGQLKCSYVDETGEIKFKFYDWASPTAWETCNPNDTNVDKNFKSWNDLPIKKVPVNFPNRYSTYDFLDELPDKDKNDLFDYHEPKPYFIDIETKIIEGFPHAVDQVEVDDNGNETIIEGTKSPILSISIVYENKIILLGLEEMPKSMQKRIIDNTNKYFKKLNDGVEYEFQYFKYDSEFDMVHTFFNKMVPKMPMIIGWNVIDYDWQYLVNRSRKLMKSVNGKTYTINPSVSSPTNRLEKQWMSTVELPKHRMIFDYMKLYEAFDTSIKIKESKSLDFVSSNVLGVTKIHNRYEDNPKYDKLGKSVVGDLQKLYEEDFETYMFYNCVDSILVQKIHDKMNYISIIYAVSVLANIKIADVFNMNKGTPALASLAITEGVLRKRFREQDNVILFKDKNRNTGASGISGGWVKDPKQGMNLWVAVYDFASLYPSVMKQWFIAPENYVGTKINNSNVYIDSFGKRKEIDLEKMVVCINGEIFMKRDSPTINMLIDVYNERKKTKKRMMALNIELDELKHQRELLLQEF